MNGSLHDSMTHLDMNNGNGANVNDNGLPIVIQQSKLGKNNNSNSSSSNSQKSQSNDNSQRLELELELDPQHSNNNNTINARPQDATATNNDNSVNVNVNNSNLPHPDPNHNEFATQSGGQTTCQHTAINYTDYRRRASDAMSIDLPSDLGGAGGDAVGGTVGNGDAVILQQQQDFCCISLLLLTFLQHLWQRGAHESRSNAFFAYGTGASHPCKAVFSSTRCDLLIMSKVYSNDKYLYHSTALSNLYPALSF